MEQAKEVGGTRHHQSSLTAASNRKPSSGIGSGHMMTIRSPALPLNKFEPPPYQLRDSPTTTTTSPVTVQPLSTVPAKPRPVVVQPSANSVPPTDADATGEPENNKPVCNFYRRYRQPGEFENDDDGGGGGDNTGVFRGGGMWRGGQDLGDGSGGGGVVNHAVVLGGGSPSSSGTRLVVRQRPQTSSASSPRSPLVGHRPISDYHSNGGRERHLDDGLSVKRRRATFDQVGLRVIPNLNSSL